MNIDALVATRVMRWERCEKLCRWVYGPTLADTESGAWSPSTDPSDMMVAVDHLIDLGNVVSAHGDNERGYAVTFYPRRAPHLKAVGEAKALPLAVSFAALRAVGTPEDEITKALEER